MNRAVIHAAQSLIALGVSMRPRYSPTDNSYSRLMTHRIQIKSRLIFNSISSSAREGKRESAVHASNQPSGGEYRRRRPEKSLTPSGQVFYFPHGFLGHSPSGVQVGASLGDVVYTFRDKTSTCSWQQSTAR